MATKKKTTPKKRKPLTDAEKRFRKHISPPRPTPPQPPEIMDRQLCETANDIRGDLDLLFTAVLELEGDLIGGPNFFQSALFEEARTRYERISETLCHMYRTRSFVAGVIATHKATEKAK